VDDCTRKTPTAQILPYVLEALQSAGVHPQQITIVVALGTHRPMTAGELHAKLGAAANGPYPVVNTPATDPHGFADAGCTASLRPDLVLPPIPAQINRHVLEADLRIGIGMITPHLDAGYSGGAKIVLPGVCSLATVDAFHLASAFVEGNQLGNPDAPLRCLLERFVSEHAPLHFIVNAILGPDGSLHACVAGDAGLAQRAGAELARQAYGLPAPRRYPVVVANCAPYDQDLWQSIKGAWAGDLLAEDDGDLILVTAAPEGNSLYPLVPCYAGMDPDLLRAAIFNGNVEDAMQAATGVLWGTLRRRVRLSIVSRGLGAETAAAMGAGFYDTVEAATAAAVARLPANRRNESVAVIPQAGVALPLPEIDNP
jgi:nickel-dependent lactate racemase